MNDQEKLDQLEFNMDVERRLDDIMLRLSEIDKDIVVLDKKLEKLNDFEGK